MSSQLNARRMPRQLKCSELQYSRRCCVYIEKNKIEDVGASNYVIIKHSSDRHSLSSKKLPTRNMSGGTLSPTYLHTQEGNKNIHRLTSGDVSYLYVFVHFIKPQIIKFSPFQRHLEKVDKASFLYKQQPYRPDFRSHPSLPFLRFLFFPFQQLCLRDPFLKV